MKCGECHVSITSGRCRAGASDGLGEGGDSNNTGSAAAE